MFERLQKPFLTVETGEAYQPIRLSYTLNDKDKLHAALEKLLCCEKGSTSTVWNWFWKAECDNLHFESIDNFRKNGSHPLRLGTITLRDNKLFINLPSFKRACLAVSFFYKMFGNAAVEIDHADFINKVYGTDERLPHGFTELFKDDELEKIVQQRMHDFEEVQKKCENADSAEQAISIVSDFTYSEGHKKLPHLERYSFAVNRDKDTEVLFLSFFVFLRSREIVAIRRWMGETGYTLYDAAEEIVETEKAMDQVFGGMDIDIIE